MKKLGIDMRLYSQTGVGVYLRNLLHELLPILPEDIQCTAYVLPEDAHKLPQNACLTVKEAPYRWHTVAEQTSFLNLLNRDGNDLVHFTYFGYPVMFRKKFIATVHDITPLLFQTGKASTRNPFVYRLKYHAFRHILKTQVNNAAAIITPTSTVKEQLTRTFGKNLSERITPIYEGVDYGIAESQEDTALYERFTKPYLLYVGNFYPHKNLERLIEGFRHIDVNVPLLLVGPDDFFARRLKENLKKAERRLNIHFFHHPSVAQLHFFYRHALAFVHPTLSEGFGLPLVEAAHFNVPIIASNIPVVKELLGDHYTAFDPLNPEDITAKINDFIARPETPEYSSILGRYSFKKMAEGTLALYMKYL